MAARGRGRRVYHKTRETLWATCNFLKFLTPISSSLQLFEASRTTCNSWSFLRHIRAPCNYLKLLAPISSHLQLFFVAPMSSHLQLFEASCTNLEPLANIFMHLEPLLSLLQLFEAFRTYRKPLEIIWSFLHQFWANCNYLQLLEPI